MYYICFDKTKQVSFASAGRSVTYNSTPHPKRNIDSVVLLVGYSGECAISQNGIEHILKKGTFRILFPHTTHYGTVPTSENQSHFWCHFYLPDGFFIKEANDYSELENDKTCVLPEFSDITSSEKYFVLFSQMIDEAEKMYINSKKQSDVCDLYIKILLISLSENYKESVENIKNGYVATFKIQEWIRNNASRGIGVKECAKEFGYNPDYLSQLIKKDTGKTLCAYINDIRLMEAKKLLLNSTLTVSEIAYAVGFGDEKYFMRLFKKTQNVTPTQYRNAHFMVHINSNFVKEIY